MIRQQNMSAGEQLARKLERRRYLVILSQLLALTYILISQIIYISTWVLPVLLLFAVFCVVWNSRSDLRLQRILSHELDPILYKEVLEYKRGKAGNQSHKDAYSVLIAQCLVWQGYPKNAYQVINKIDFKHLPEKYLLIGHLCCCHYFFELRNISLLKDMQQLYEREWTNHGLPPGIQKKCDFIVCTIHMYIAILEGDKRAFTSCLEEYHRLADIPIRRVYADYLQALMYTRVQENSKAETMAQQVMAQGGKLCIAWQAQQLLDTIRQKKNVWELQGPVASVTWTPESLMKSEVDYAYFKKNIRHDFWLRLLYTVGIPLAFFVGFFVGVFRGYQYLGGSVMVALYIFSGIYYMIYANAILLLITYFFSRNRSRFVSVILLMGALFFGGFMLISGIVIVPYYIYNTVMLAKEWSQNRSLLKREGRKG